MFFILTNIYICIHKRIRLQLYWIRKMKKQKQKEYSVETINLLIDHSQSSKIFLDSHTLIYVIHITYTALFYIFACTSSSPFLLPLQSLSSLHRLYFAVSSVYCTPFRFSWVFVKKRGCWMWVAGHMNGSAIASRTVWNRTVFLDERTGLRFATTFGVPCIIGTNCWS